jgi:hypothetical protein
MRSSPPAWRTSSPKPTGACAARSGGSTTTIERNDARAEPAEDLRPLSLPAGPWRLAFEGSVDTVHRATGYRRAYPWLDVPVLDGDGELGTGKA